MLTVQSLRVLSAGWRNVRSFKHIASLWSQFRQIDDAKNYFELFRIETKFDLDQSSLSNEFKALQRIFHPDKFANKPAVCQLIQDEIFFEIVLMF